MKKILLLIIAEIILLSIITIIHFVFRISMNGILLLIIAEIIMITIATIAYFFLHRAENKRLYLKVLFYAAVGWTLALVIRLIPLQLLQLYFLGQLGADLSSSESIQAVASANATHWSLLIWGPIFAGLFEEPIRWIFFRQSMKSREDRKLSPLIFGLGWGAGEAVLIYLTQIFNLQALDPELELTLLELVLVVFERTVITGFHIAMTMIVFYAIYEKFPKISLIIGIFVHIFLDMLIVISIWTFPNSTDEIWYAVLLEAAFLIITLISLVFAYKYWIPKREVELKEQIDTQASLDRQILEQKAQIEHYYTQQREAMLKQPPDDTQP